MNALKDTFDAERVVVPLSSRIEAEIAELPAEDQILFIEELGMDSSGLTLVIREAYALLGLYPSLRQTKMKRTHGRFLAAQALMTQPV